MEKKNNVVDFAEGILGIGNARNTVAKCLREESSNHGVDTGLRMIAVADDLDLGNKIDIQRLRNIGEKPLHATERMFLRL